MGEGRLKDTTRSSQPNPECETFCGTNGWDSSTNRGWGGLLQIKRFKRHCHMEYMALVLPESNQQYKENFETIGDISMWNGS